MGLCCCRLRAVQEDEQLLAAETLLVVAGVLLQVQGTLHQAECGAAGWFDRV